MKKRINLTITFLLSACCLYLNAQNKADRYLDAYKKYETASCPIPGDNIKHFVYFARDRAAIVDHPLLTNSRFAGAQVMYSWRDFEIEKGIYDFSVLKADIGYLAKHGKKLFIQLQDASFNPNNKAIPDYLFTAEYDSGAVLRYNDQGKADGWVAKRWNKKLRERFALLLAEMGKNFDGKIEGINLQETAIGINSKTHPEFSAKEYVNGLKENMLSLKKAFPKSVTMIYANFIPGEWLPWDDKGYLRSIYSYGEEIGVGLGGPDLMVTRKGQLNHALAMMHEHNYTVPLGIAVQDGNYTGTTGADADYDQIEANGKKKRKSIVPLLYSFARDFLKVNFIFWVDQEPYFKEDLLTCMMNKRKVIN